MSVDDRRLAAGQDAWQGVEPAARAMSRRIWETPELGMMEYEAEAALSAWLAGEGFAVERGACGLPTAFRAVWSNGAGPVLGFMAEYDALPGQGNRLEPLRAPDGKRAGHACGHNLIGGTAAGSAIALRHAMETTGQRGTVVVLGTPAEEILWGKIAMLRGGAFDGIDVLFANHADYQNGAVSRPCLSCVSSELVFRGVSGHGGSRRSQNALDAAELFVQSMERLRAHQFNDAVIGHVLRVAGHMPSITPEEARLWITVRHESFERAEEVYGQILPIAHDSARHTGTRLSEYLIAASRGYLPNHTLGATLRRACEHVGPPAWDAADLAWMEELAGRCSPGRPFALDREVRLHTEGCDPFGQDDGEASHYIPLARINWAYPAGVLFHNWAATAASGHESQSRGACFAGQAMVLAALDLLADPATVAEAEAERARRVGGRLLSAPRCGGFEVMTSNPASFWDATWEGDRGPAG